MKYEDVSLQNCKAYLFMGRIEPCKQRKCQQKKECPHTTKGNSYVKSMLCEVSWGIAGKRNTYLSCWYWRLKQKKGTKKAIIALARKLLVIIYTMLKKGTM